MAAGLLERDPLQELVLMRARASARWLTTMMRRGRAEEEEILGEDRARRGCRPTQTQTPT